MSGSSIATKKRKFALIGSATGHPSRIRFAISAAVLIGFCLFATISRRPLGPVGSGNLTLRIHHLIYSGTAKGTFTLLSLFLGLGGLVRERARRTSTFTLALPVTRFQIVGTQIGMGLLQVAVLSLLPVLLLPLLSRLMREPVALRDTLHYSILWFVCGSTIFAVAYLLSVVLEGVHSGSILLHFAHAASPGRFVAAAPTRSPEPFVDHGGQ